MGDLLNFNDHIDKSENKQRYLGYEKGKVLEETIKELIAKIPDIPEETIINYFTKIVKGEIPVMDDKPFHTKYVCIHDAVLQEGMVLLQKQNLAIYLA